MDMRGEEFAALSIHFHLVNFLLRTRSAGMQLFRMRKPDVTVLYA